MNNFFEKFSNLRRWIRVYICFIIPAVGAVIPLFFLKYLITYIIIGADILFLLPLFIYSEEIKHDKEREENQKLVNQNITYYLMTINKKLPEAKIDSNPKNIFELKIDGIEMDQVIYYKNGDTLTIQHKPSNEYPNNIFITNDRTGTILGTLELSLAINLIEKYGCKCIFKGEIDEVIPSDNEKFKCSIKILKQIN